MSRRAGLSIARPRPFRPHAKRRLNLIRPRFCAAAIVLPEKFPGADSALIALSAIADGREADDSFRRCGVCLCRKKAPDFADDPPGLVCLEEILSKCGTV